MFRHVLVPLDGQFPSKTTLMTAAAIANEHDAKVTLLYVTDLAREFAACSLPVIAASEIERHEARVRNFLTDASAIVQEYGGTCMTHIAQGAPVHKVINSVAGALNVDVIVMGTRGRRGFTRAIWGSVSDDVLRSAGVPVLLVHESEFKRRSPSPVSKKT